MAGARVWMGLVFRLIQTTSLHEIHKNWDDDDPQHFRCLRERAVTQSRSFRADDVRTGCNP